MNWTGFYQICICGAFCLAGIRGETWMQNGENNYPRQKAKGVENSFSRMGRFLSLFTFVQFDNQACTGSNGENGTCVSQTDCQRKGGTSIGNCASGYGVCCSMTVKCGGIVRENGTFFVNEGYPDSYNGVGSCQVTLMKINPIVCQFRLDFDVMNIMGPETINHICINDQFIVSGGNPSAPAICGRNDGNHLYIAVEKGPSASPVSLNVVTTGDSFQRSWKIRITQIPCSSEVKAENGCLQYFTGVSGQIKSFNYDLTTGRQLSNQDYTICVRAERNFCGIQYTQCVDNVNTRYQSFTLSGNSNQAVPSMVGSTGNTNFCPNDYLIIPMATNVDRVVQSRSPTVDRICGGTFSADVTQTPTTVLSTVRPFLLFFHTDSTENPMDQENKGFCLNYVQQPCTNRLQ
ncbi:uncharacterized protein LOC109544925 isoform X2 [Dendroctonus ponderosae]|uniref:CUB domain-containing protein n=2 Tax=Dendroctonus ponderosae TaxID=77166 RepID=U4U9X9_DENPD|nr:uncharacterized protein LOC109544925 isoform X2 [Dendroctonus ponderosae]XP_048524916.1 uncharacterized protein LOC109544925 isoform X2 [Dendroctonus ponderosae]ERL86760.1 hypothetical protein D910_04166 [Dendroctonus ponderosae]KAH1010013.1 hypothetical protein HUJ05_004376 [Dendroctonus ponderosae]